GRYRGSADQDVIQAELVEAVAGGPFARGRVRADDLEQEFVGARLELHVLELRLLREEVVRELVHRLGDDDAVHRNPEDPVIGGPGQAENDRAESRFARSEAELEAVARTRVPEQVLRAAPRPPPERGEQAVGLTPGA